MKKKFIYLCLVVALFLSMNFQVIESAGGKTTKFTDVGNDYVWAKEAISELSSKGVISGVDSKTFAPSSPVTKEQFAKMLVLALDIELSTETDTVYSDISSDRWSLEYINSVDSFFAQDKNNDKFNPTENYTREKCAYAVSMALGVGQDEKKLLDKNVLKDHFKDEDDISSPLKTAVAIATERGIIKGSDNLLRPDGEVTRAEAAVILQRAIRYKERNSQNLFITQTPLTGESTVSLEQAKKWAEKRGAHERFIEIADIYWKYGEITGIRPEVLYGQAAKETAYGKYTGQVKPEQNNWAGIKIKNPTGDAPEDHETFLTPDDGVRAHFNHMSQYAGVDPVGEPHDRYFVLNTVPWRGTVEYVEQLGGKWAPDVTYGYSIVINMLRSMENTK